MPKVLRNKDATTQLNVSRRIEFERTKRGWTYGGLAKRMEDAGCPMHASAIHKTEKADPPRKVTLTELLAFANVFEIDVADMFIPVSDIQDAEAQRISDDLDAAFDKLVEASESILNLYVESLAIVADMTGDSHPLFAKLAQVSGVTEGGPMAVMLTGASADVEAKFWDVLSAYNTGLWDTAGIQVREERGLEVPQRVKSKRGK